MAPARAALPPLDEASEPALAPYRYLAENPGKNVRDSLIDAMAEAWAPAAPGDVALIKAMVAKLHTASLLVDDVEDSSPLRRGRPAAHVVHGAPLTINAANLVYFLVLEQVLLLPSPLAAAAEFAREMVCLHRGQGWDLYWREKEIVPSVGEWLAMVQDKTGGLFRMAARLLHCVASRDQDSVKPLEAILQVCNDLASFFQIRDDFLNLFSAKFTEQKGYAEDIGEGKMSYLVVTAVDAFRTGGEESKAKELLGVLASRTDDQAMRRRAVELIVEAGARQGALDVLDDLKKRIIHGIDAIGGNQRLVDLLGALSVLG